jgi:hypothetical protein
MADHVMHTMRQERIIKTRKVNNVYTKRQDVPNRKADPNTYILWVKAEVQRNNAGEVMRLVVAKLFVDEGTVKAISGIHCIQRTQEDIPCRNDDNGCVHVAALLKKILSMRPGSTDADCQWLNGEVMFRLSSAVDASRYCAKSKKRVAEDARRLRECLTLINNAAKIRMKKKIMDVRKELYGRKIK